MEAVAGGHMVGRSAHEQPVLTAPRWAGQRDSSTFDCRFTRYAGNKQQRTSLGSQSLRSFSHSLLHFPSPMLMLFLLFLSHFYDDLLFFSLEQFSYVVALAHFFTNFFVCAFSLFTSFLAHLSPSLFILHMLSFPSLYWLLLQLQTSFRKTF